MFSKKAQKMMKGIGIVIAIMVILSMTLLYFAPPGQGLPF